MLFLISLVVLTLIFTLISREFDDSEIAFNLAGLFGVILIAALVFWPISYYSSKAEVDRYYALERSLEESRSGNVSDVERAAVTNEIIDYNKDLASVRYWNKSIFDIYIYDGLAELPYLK